MQTSSGAYGREFLPILQNFANMAQIGCFGEAGRGAGSALPSEWRESSQEEHDAATAEFRLKASGRVRVNTDAALVEWTDGGFIRWPDRTKATRRPPSANAPGVIAANRAFELVISTLVLRARILVPVVEAEESKILYARNMQAGVPASRCGAAGEIKRGSGPGQGFSGFA